MWKYNLLILPVLLILSCSIDYGDTEFADEIDRKIPDNIIEDFSYTSVDNGTIVFRLYAKKASNYSQKKETVLEDAVFREYNRNGEIITEGRADSGVIYTESDDSELTGSLKIYSAVNESEIYTDYLYWDDSEKSLYSSEKGQVRMHMDSGTEISGNDFKGDLRTRTFTFNSNVQGKYLYEED